MELSRRFLILACSIINSLGVGGTIVSEKGSGLEAALIITLMFSSVGLLASIFVDSD